jgi:hypothetical protein
MSPPTPRIAANSFPAPRYSVARLMSKHGDARLTDLRDFPSLGALGRLMRPRRASYAMRWVIGRRALLPRCGNLLQGLGIFGQFIGDALKCRIVITRLDRLLRIARHRFDGRLLLLRARWQ